MYLLIIDTHVHIGNFLDFNLSPKDVLYSMEKYNIDYSLVSSIEAAEYDHRLKPIPMYMQKSQTECLKKCINFACDNYGKIGVAVWIKPATETANSELKELISKNLDVVKAVKVHPFHSKTAFDGEKMLSFISLAKKFDLPIVVHTGGCDEASPKRVYNAAKIHPDVNFIMVHMGLGTDNSEAMNLICRLPNLYGDTTWVPMKNTVELIKRSSSKKVLFGSDNPIDGRDTYFHNRTNDRSIYQDYFNEIKELITPRQYDDLMWRNAKELFKINF